MTDNIAHDLRSPIGRIRLLSESLLQADSTTLDVNRTAEDSITECDRLIRMINLSLDVAETEAGVGRSQKKPVNLALLVKDACEHFDVIAEQKAITLEVVVRFECMVSGETNAIQRIVANLLDYALKYSCSGDSVSVLLERHGSNARLSIRDTGIGIPTSAYETIFERFYHVDPSRSNEGCGLGLSYARAVARNHLGDFTVSSVEGKYSLFTVELSALDINPDAESIEMMPMCYPVSS